MTTMAASTATGESTATSRYRALANKAMTYQSALLHAVAGSAAELLGNSLIDDAVPKALEKLGKAVHVQQVVVLEAQPPPEEYPSLVLRYTWQAADAPVIVDQTSFCSRFLSGSSLTLVQATCRRTPRHRNVRHGHRPHQRPVCLLRHPVDTRGALDGRWPVLRPCQFSRLPERARMDRDRSRHPDDACGF